MNMTVEAALGDGVLVSLSVSGVVMISDECKPSSKFRMFEDGDID